ncbi:hypothetical protein ACFFX0_19375 [Citricoccus parietis]|uniref:Uncharacterized protein n=1 Tax=Citricoccus parietis TaxID=592307 RepID=A0ABV5G2U3_9MICC
MADPAAIAGPAGRAGPGRTGHRGEGDPLAARPRHAPHRSYYADSLHNPSRSSSFTYIVSVPTLV